MLRKRKFRDICLNSTFRIRYVRPLEHLAFVQKWGLVDFYQDLRYNNIRIVYFSVHLLQAVRQEIRCVVPLSAILIVAREFSAARTSMMSAERLRPCAQLVLLAL
jgi:hypothetical protein